MTFSFLYRVRCCGAPIYEGRDEALASRIFDHLASCSGHRVVLEEANTDGAWEKIELSPTTETHHPEV
jgi:hypothetical protein